MPFKLNIQSATGLVEIKLSHKPAMVKDFIELTSYHKEMRGMPPADKDVEAFKLRLQAILTAAVSAGGRLLGAECISALDVSGISTLDRFCIVHLVSVQMAFLHGLQEVIATVTLLPEEQGGRPKSKAHPKKQPEGFGSFIEEAAAIELPFSFGVDPATEVTDYLREQGQIIFGLLDAKLATWVQQDTLGRCVEGAIRHYVIWASRTEGAPEIIASYLNFKQQIAQHGAVLDNVHGVSTALENWLAEASDHNDRRRAAWHDYRQNLMELPDDKTTMFDESFGVRKVFVQPVATYRVAGIKREAEIPVSDVAGLLGTLISDRTDGEDLILLCGGPGSGKSTLCRILASELARNERVHPVFLRLRRLQDSKEIIPFLEEHLQRAGLIDKIADLAQVPNLVLILDGFDELVIASRSRLREFFNVLKDDLSSGPLRHAKAIVSGRDTLFPKGVGLPIGAHVVSLRPFDKPRIGAWGKKWRQLHTNSAAMSFFPENLVSDDRRHSRRDTPPLEHLVSWPLTLHLVARAHTSGSINLDTSTSGQVEKAVLYRSIVADTALRQSDQSTGKGRLNSNDMRKFVQAVAWEMYSSGREALDVSEGLPILRTIYKDASEADLMELADVTIVNQPELTKGEETGFEFVHKSFSEYFAAEKIATSIEQVCFKGAEWGVAEQTWRMSVNEATAALANLFAIKLLTPEVQEMLEPMLGDFGAFLTAEKLRISTTEADGPLLLKLDQKLERFEGLIADFAGGGLLAIVSQAAKSSKLINSDLEGFGNYASALLFLATTLSARMKKLNLDATRLAAVPAPNLIRLIHIVLAGDIPIDSVYAHRAFRRLDATTDKNSFELLFPPLAPALLHHVRGLNIGLQSAVADVSTYLAMLELDNMLMRLFVEVLSETGETRGRPHRTIPSYGRHRSNLDAIEYLQHFIGPQEIRRGARVGNSVLSMERRFREVLEELSRLGRIDIKHPAIEELMQRVRSMMQDANLSRRSYMEVFDRIEYLLRDVENGKRF